VKRDQQLSLLSRLSWIMAIDRVCFSARARELTDEIDGAGLGQLILGFVENGARFNMLVTSPIKC
jgi:hypothetical protein